MLKPIRALSPLQSVLKLSNLPADITPTQIRQILSYVKINHLTGPLRKVHSGVTVWVYVPGEWVWSITDIAVFRYTRRRSKYRENQASPSRRSRPLLRIPILTSLHQRMQDSQHLQIHPQQTQSRNSLGNPMICSRQSAKSST